MCLQRKGQLKPVESKIKVQKLANPPDVPEMVTNFDSVEPCPEDNDLQQELLNLLVILKLNGGLGTSMGCKVKMRTMTFYNACLKQME